MWRNISELHCGVTSRAREACPTKHPVHTLSHLSKMNEILNLKIHVALMDMHKGLWACVINTHVLPPSLGKKILL